MTEGENMVERLAQVLWDARIAPGGGGRTLMPWPFCPEHDWCVNTARAVIEALMEPTKEMLEAGNTEARDWIAIDGYESTGFYPDIDPQLAYATFTTMLRTSLSQPNEEGEGK